MAERIHVTEPEPELARLRDEDGMTTMRHGLGIDDVVARERRLTRRAAALKLLATLTGAASAIAFVVALLGTRDAVAALIAASPLVLALVAAGWAFVTDEQRRRYRLLVAVLADPVRERDAAPTRRIARLRRYHRAERGTRDRPDAHGGRRRRLNPEDA